MAGPNRIEIKSVNLWVNRLIGDVQPGVTRKVTFTWLDGKPLPAGAASRGTRLRDALSGGFPAAGIWADRPRQNRPRGASELKEQEHEFIVRS